MLTLFHDYTSAPSAVAVLRLHRLAEDGLPVAFTGIDVLGLDRAIPPTPALLDGLKRHHDALREHGIDPVRPRMQPPTLGAHIAGELADDAGVGMSWRRCCYRAFWEESADLSDAAVLADLAVEVGVDGDAVSAAVTDRVRRLELRQRMITHRGEGVGGVPVLQAGGTYVSAFLPEDDLRQLATL